MDETNASESIRNLNPSNDKLGKDRDFKDAVCVRLNALEEDVRKLIIHIRELELCLEEKGQFRESPKEDSAF
jgi:hypothetical protein